MQPLFRASEGILAQKMMSLAATVLLLQQMMILPTEGVSQTCDIVIYEPYKKTNMNFLYWECPVCKLCCHDTFCLMWHQAFECWLNHEKQIDPLQRSSLALGHDRCMCGAHRSTFRQCLGRASPSKAAQVTACNFMVCVNSSCLQNHRDNECPHRWGLEIFRKAHQADHDARPKVPKPSRLPPSYLRRKWLK